MSGFQASSGIQGRQFTEQCNQLLGSLGFELHGTVDISSIGVEVDQLATSPHGNAIWFEYKGSIQGSRPGLMRTDTTKKAIANGALLAALEQHPPYVILTSHLPRGGAASAMLDAARDLGYFHDVVCIYDPEELVRLKDL